MALGLSGALGHTQTARNRWYMLDQAAFSKSAALRVFFACHGLAVLGALRLWGSRVLRAFGFLNVRAGRGCSCPFGVSSFRVSGFGVERFKALHGA